jgi:hypothetical protein
MYCVGFGNQYTLILTEHLSVAASRFAVHLNDSNVILNLPSPNSATDQQPLLGSSTLKQTLAEAFSPKRSYTAEQRTVAVLGSCAAGAAIQLSHPV